MHWQWWHQKEHWPIARLLRRSMIIGSCCGPEWGRKLRLLVDLRVHQWVDIHGVLHWRNRAVGHGEHKRSGTRRSEPSKAPKLEPICFAAVGSNVYIDPISAVPLQGVLQSCDIPKQASFWHRLSAW